MYKRKMISIITIAVGLVGWFAFNQRTSIGTYEYPSYINILIFMLWVWLAISLSSKIAMIFGKRLWILPFSSVVLFCVLGFISIVSVHEIIPSERLIFYDILVRLCLLIWVMVDLCDLGFIQMGILKYKAIQRECDSVIKKGNKELHEDHSKIKAIASSFGHEIKKQ